MEWRLAAAWAHIPWEHFIDEMDGPDESQIIAAYRIAQYSEAVAAQDASRKAQG